MSNIFIPLLVLVLDLVVLVFCPLLSLPINNDISIIIPIIDIKIRVDFQFIAKPNIKNIDKTAQPNHIVKLNYLAY